MKWTKILIVGAIVAICFLFPYAMGWILFGNGEIENGDEEWWYDPPEWLENSPEWQKVLSEKGLHAKMLDSQPIGLSINEVVNIQIELESCWVDVYNLMFSVDGYGLPIDVWYVDQEFYYTSTYHGIKIGCPSIYYYLCLRNRTYFYNFGEIPYNGIYIIPFAIRQIGEMGGNQTITLHLDYEFIDRTVPHTPHCIGQKDINIQIKGE